MPTITYKATVEHFQQANKTHGKQHQTYEKYTTMDKVLKHQVIESVKGTYITELCNKYTGFMGFKETHMIHHLIHIYKKFTEKDLKDDHKIFDDAYDTKITTNK